MPEISKALFDIIIAHYTARGIVDLRHKSFTVSRKHQDQPRGEVIYLL